MKIDTSSMEDDEFLFFYKLMFELVVSRCQNSILKFNVNPMDS